jgi:hypothetical protein
VKQQIAALPPPQRSLDIGGAAEIGREIDDRLRRIDDRIKRRIEPLDALGGLCLGGAITTAKGKSAGRSRHGEHVPPRNSVSRTHEFLPRVVLGEL